MPSTSADVVTTVVYGTTATIIGVVTIYQSYLAWRLWREHHHHHHPGQSSQGLSEMSSQLTPKDKLCLPLHIDVELASGSTLVVQQPLPNAASTDIVPVNDTNNHQSVADQVTAFVSPQPLGPSTSSTADPEPVEVTNDLQDAASLGIAPDAAFDLPLQPSQSRQPDVMPVQDTISTQAVANPRDPPVSCPTLNSPDVPASSSTSANSTDGS